MINVYLVAKKKDIQDFCDNFVIEDEMFKKGSLPEMKDKEGKEYNPRKLVKAHLASVDMYREDGVIAKKKLISIYVKEVEEDGKLLAVEKLGMEVLGAWDCVTGVQYGQTLVPAVLDEEGVEITPETIEGDPVYPADLKEILKYMPDDVEYNHPDGSVKSRKKATEFKQVNKILGHADRRI